MMSQPETPFRPTTTSPSEVGSGKQLEWFCTTCGKKSHETWVDNPLRLDDMQRAIRSGHLRRNPTHNVIAREATEGAVSMRGIVTTRPDVTHAQDYAYAAGPRDFSAKCQDCRYGRTDMARVQCRDSAFQHSKRRSHEVGVLENGVLKQTYRNGISDGVVVVVKTAPTAAVPNVTEPPLPPTPPPLASPVKMIDVKTNASTLHPGDISLLKVTDDEIQFVVNDNGNLRIKSIKRNNNGA